MARPGGRDSRIGIGAVGLALLAAGALAAAGWYAVAQVPDREATHRADRPGAPPEIPSPTPFATARPTSTPTPTPTPSSGAAQGASPDPGFSEARSFDDPLRAMDFGSRFEPVPELQRKAKLKRARRRPADEKEKSVKAKVKTAKLSKQRMCTKRCRRDHCHGRMDQDRIDCVDLCRQICARPEPEG